MNIKQGVSKAEAARQLQVSKPRVTQYVQSGMPVLPDGSIDLREARQWLEANLDPAKRMGHAEAKRARLEAQALAGPWGYLMDFTKPTHRGFAYAAGLAIYRAAFHAALAAAEVGLDREKAVRLGELVTIRVWVDLEIHAGELGLVSPDGGEDIFHLEGRLLDDVKAKVPWDELYGPDGASLVTGADTA